MPSAEDMAASLEAGETMDDQFLAGHGGKILLFLFFEDIVKHLVFGLGLNREHKLA